MAMYHSWATVPILYLDSQVIIQKSNPIIRFSRVSDAKNRLLKRKDTLRDWLATLTTATSVSKGFIPTDGGSQSDGNSDIRPGRRSRALSGAGEYWLRRQQAQDWAVKSLLNEINVNIKDDWRKNWIDFLSIRRHYCEQSLPRARARNLIPSRLAMEDRLFSLCPRPNCELLRLVIGYVVGRNSRDSSFGAASSYSAPVVIY